MSNNSQKHKGAKNNFKNNKNGKPKGNQDKRTSRSKDWSKRDDTNGDAPGQNDVSWYKMTDQIVKDAGQFSFNNPLGITLDNIVDSARAEALDVIPGVAAILYSPTLGDSSDVTSPVNLQAKKLISFLQSQVSANLKMSAADAMMYLVAMDNMYSFYSFCVRLYGIHYSYISMNRYYPSALIKAMGVDASPRSDWNKFRAWLNTWAYQLSQLYVPATMTYFQRHMWMNANIYLDAPDAKSQSYVFVPTHMYKWDGSTDEYGTKLVYTPLPNVTGAGSATLEDFMEFGDTLLGDLLQDIDIANISGLILRAFGDNNCIKMNTIPEDFMVSPVYNTEVLSQIHNATICGPVYSGLAGNGDITQTINDTLSVSYVTNNNDTSSLRHLIKNRLLDLKTPSPTIDDTFIATRLMACGSLVGGNNNLVTLDTYGTEIVTKIVLHTYKNGVIEETSLASSCVSQSVDTAGTIVGQTMAFDDFPLLFSVTVENSFPFITAILGNINNYTIMTKDDLKKIHSASTIALFDIPLINKTR